MSVASTPSNATSARPRPGGVLPAGEPEQLATRHDHGIAPIAGILVKSTAHLFHDEEWSKDGLAIAADGEAWFHDGTAASHFLQIVVLLVVLQSLAVDIVVNIAAAMRTRRITVFGHGLEAFPLGRRPVAG